MSRVNNKRVFEVIFYDIHRILQPLKKDKFLKIKSERRGLYWYTNTFLSFAGFREAIPRLLSTYAKSKLSHNVI